MLLDEKGEILLANRAWREFAQQNGAEMDKVSVGANYFAACQTESGEWVEVAKPFASGLSKVLSSELKSFNFEYPCHSPDQQRWFVGKITAYQRETSSYIVIAHENITERKLAEDNLQEAKNNTAPSRTIFRSVFPRKGRWPTLIRKSGPDKDVEIQTRLRICLQSRALIFIPVNDLRRK